MSGPSGPLVGLKIVEFGEATAGPLAGGLLADFGADVVHVEHPMHGDSHRSMGPARDGVHLWWKVSGRNKRSVTLDLSSSRGQEIAHELVAWADAVIANLRPSVLEAWHLDWPQIHRINPQAVMLQVSGYGATSTKRDAPGFGKMGEARSGAAHLSGLPEGPPIHSGFSQAVTVTALMGSWALLVALWRRGVQPATFEGEWIDLALYEPLFRLIEWQIVVYDQLGVVPARAGNRLRIADRGLVNTYQARDGNWITVSAPTPKAMRNIVNLVGHDDHEPQGAGRRADADTVDARLKQWLAARTTARCIEELSAADVAASPILSAADIVEDGEYRERANIVVVDDPQLGHIRMQAPLPHMRVHPGKIWRCAPELGADNELVFGEWLGMSAEEMAQCHAQGVM